METEGRNEQQTSPSVITPSPVSNQSRKIMMISVFIVVLLAIGAGGYILNNQLDKSATVLAQARNVVRRSNTKLLAEAMRYYIQDSGQLPPAITTSVKNSPKTMSYILIVPVLVGQ